MIEVRGYFEQKSLWVITHVFFLKTNYTVLTSQLNTSSLNIRTNVVFVSKIFICRVFALPGPQVSNVLYRLGWLLALRLEPFHPCLSLFETVCVHVLSCWFIKCQCLTNNNKEKNINSIQQIARTSTYWLQNCHIPFLEAGTEFWSSIPHFNQVSFITDELLNDNSLIHGINVIHLLLTHNSHILYHLKQAFLQSC